MAALVDNLCLDTPVYGNPETFINKDVLVLPRRPVRDFLRREIPAALGQRPFRGGYPGAEHPDTTLREIFGGDQGAYDAQKPVTILRGRHYSDTAAVFTVSNDDPIYVDAARKNNDAARSAGMTVTYVEIPNAGHVIGALNGGLREGFRALYSRLGLTRHAPATEQ